MNAVLNFPNDILHSIPIVTDSPYSERMERKDSIRRFLKEQFRDEKKAQAKELAKEQAKEAAAAAAAAAAANGISDAESIKSNVESTKSKSSAYRLFRTVSSAASPLFKLLVWKKK